MRSLNLTNNILFLLLLTSLLLSACSSGDTPTAQPPAPEATGDSPGGTEAPATAAPDLEPTQDSPKSAAILYTQPIDTFNPMYTNLYYSQITHQIWNCWAWDFDSQANPRPVLVKEIPSIENGGISGDGRTITMSLRDDIRWSDGVSITAADFVFTYRMYTDPQNSVVSISPYDRIESVTAPDERTVVVTFREPYVPWLYSLWRGLLPSHILQPVYDSLGTLNNASWNSAPTVGCGPYNFMEWEPGSQVHFQVNKNYWLGEAIIDDLYIRFVADDAEQVSIMSSGEAELGTLIPFSDIPTLTGAGIQTLQVFSGWNEGWFFYLHPEKSHPALQDIRVRQAIALALDRNAITQNLMLGQTQPAISYWDNTPYIDPALQPWPYDPERAKQLLNDAGWIDNNGNGIRDNFVNELVLVYGTTTRQVRQDTQEFAKEQLAAVGIQLELVNYASDTFFSGYNAGSPGATGQLDIFQYSVKPPAFPDPDTPDFLCSEIPTIYYSIGTNWSAFCNEELDNLLQLQATQIDFNERQSTFHQISRIIYDNVYFMGLWQDPDLWAINPHLKNVELSGVTPFYNIMLWDIDD